MNTEWPAVMIVVGTAIVFAAVLAWRRLEGGRFTAKGAENRRGAEANINRQRIGGQEHDNG